LIGILKNTKKIAESGSVIQWCGFRSLS